MSESAHVSSIEAICQFAAAVAVFQEEARMCLTAMDSQLRHVQSWLEHDRPGFWKREIENCTREVTDARIRLHQCRMRRVGDFRPTCFEEQKDVERCKRNLEFAQKQIPTVKRWSIAAQHEANEFRGRCSQMVYLLERELPRLMAMLKYSVDRLESYTQVATPRSSAASVHLSRLIAQLDAVLPSGDSASIQPDPVSSEAADPDSSQPAGDTPHETI